MLFGHKAFETGASCLLLMVQGQLAQATLGHFLIASETGVLTVFPLLGITWTRHARLFSNRWVSAAICGCLRLFRGRLHTRFTLPGGIYRGRFHRSRDLCVIRCCFVHSGRKADRSAGRSISGTLRFRMSGCDCVHLDGAMIARLADPKSYNQTEIARRLADLVSL